MELVPRDSYDPVPLRRGTSRQIARAYERSLVARAAIEGAERNAAFAAQERIHNGYQLAGLTAQNAGHLSTLVTQVSRGNAGLEAELRDLEATVLYGAKAVILNYMTR
jgi:hypothetical protein